MMENNAEKMWKRCLLPPIMMRGRPFQAAAGQVSEVRDDAAFLHYFASLLGLQLLILIHSTLFPQPLHHL